MKIISSLISKLFGEKVQKIGEDKVKVLIIFDGSEFAIEENSQWDVIVREYNDIDLIELLSVYRMIFAAGGTESRIIKLFKKSGRRLWWVKDKNKLKIFMAPDFMPKKPISFLEQKDLKLKFNDQLNP